MWVSTLEELIEQAHIFFVNRLLELHRVVFRVSTSFFRLKVVSQILLRLEEELPPELDRLKPPTLARMEYEHIRRALTDYGGNVARTARDLGVDRSTLQRKLGKYPPK